jgi:hypothetical protein
MARRVILRSRQINTDVAQLEELVKAQYKAILKKHLEDLQDCTDWIEEMARQLVPYDFSSKDSNGHLQDSISVRVSKSNRYPGIIATASKKDHGWDYALIQEENEEFQHSNVYTNEKGLLVEEDTGRMAHYLGGPFAASIQTLFEDLGVPLELPANLQHALDYVEERGGI